MAVLSHIRHPGIVSVYSCFTDCIEDGEAAAWTARLDCCTRSSHAPAGRAALLLRFAPRAWPHRASPLGRPAPPFPPPDSEPGPCPRYRPALPEDAGYASTCNVIVMEVGARGKRGWGLRGGGLPARCVPGGAPGCEEPGACLNLKLDRRRPSRPLSFAPSSSVLRHGHAARRREARPVPRAHLAQRHRRRPAEGGGGERGGAADVLQLALSYAEGAGALGRRGGRSPPAPPTNALLTQAPPPPPHPPPPPPPTPPGHTVLLEVARSVEYLHERKLLHCDLKVGWGWLGGRAGVRLAACLDKAPLHLCAARPASLAARPRSPLAPGLPLPPAAPAGQRAAEERRHARPGLCVQGAGALHAPPPSPAGRASCCLAPAAAAHPAPLPRLSPRSSPTSV
jgi:hypothetical protein